MDYFFNYCFELKLHRTVEVTARGSSFHQGTQQAAESWMHKTEESEQRKKGLTLTRSLVSQEAEEKNLWELFNNEGHGRFSLGVKMQKQLYGRGSLRVHGDNHLWERSCSQIRSHEEKRGTRKRIKNSHEELAPHLLLFKVTKSTEAAVTATQLNRTVQVHRKRNPGLDDVPGSQHTRIWCSSSEKELYLPYYIKSKIILPLLLYFLLNIIFWIIPNT